MGRQKRSPNTYQKINTLFKRDDKNIIMPYDQYVDPVYEYLKDVKFDATEKVDGTNIRIEVTAHPTYALSDDGKPEDIYGMMYTVEYKGKTDNAQIPPKLLEYLKETYPENVVLSALGLSPFITVDEWPEHKWTNINDIPKKYTIYGEGYGAKIQGCGSNYLKDSVSFIGFDVKVDDIYLLKENRDDIFNKMNCPTVPFIGQFTIAEAIEFVKKGFKSRVAKANPEFLAEGLVLTTPIGLKNRNGERIIFKLKTCDWVKYYNTYGTYDKVEQKPHE